MTTTDRVGMRPPRTEAGRRLNSAITEDLEDQAPDSEGRAAAARFTGRIRAIEDESWNAALQAVEEAVGPEPPHESDYEAGVWAEWFHIRNRAIASLRKPVTP